MRRVAAVLTVGATVVAVCSSSSAAPSERRTATKPGVVYRVPLRRSAPSPSTFAPRLLTTVAEATGPGVGIFVAPGVTRPERVLGNPQPSGAPLVFLVQEQQPEWLSVLLPV